MYENIYTHKVCSIEGVEVVDNPPIYVYILSNGQRWSEKLFLKCWRKILRERCATPKENQILGTR